MKEKNKPITLESRKIKILVIDNSQDSLISIKALIKKTFQKALILTALNIKRGLELAVSEDPDVIILDIVMPVMDGFEVCKKLKADKKLSDIPVVFVTASKGDKENRIRALECGAEAFLAKPFDESELTAQIRAMVKIKAANAEKQSEKERLAILVSERTSELKVTHQATLNLLEDLRKENDARIKSQEALIQSEARFRNLLQDVQSVSVQGYAPDGTTQYWNRASELLYGYSAQEAIGQNLVDLIIPPEMRTIVKTAIQQMAETGQPIPAAELSLMRKDGSRVPVYSSNTIIQVSGEKQELFCIDIDLTERKQAAMELQESEVRYRTLFEKATEGILYLTPDLEIVMLNESFARMHGYSVEEMLNMKLEDMDTCKSSRLSTERSAYLMEKGYLKFEVEHYHKDGHIFPLEVSANLISIEGKTLIQTFHRDITERKQTDKKLRDVARLYALLSQINQAIVRTREQNELFSTICEVAIEFGRFRMAWIGLADKSSRRMIPVTHAGKEDGYLDQIKVTLGNEVTGHGPCGLAYNLGEIITSNDIATDKGIMPWRDEALKRGYRSSVAVPFRRKGKIFGALNLYASESGFFIEDERMLLEKIGENISFALDAMDSETERKLSEAELQKSYDLLSKLTAQAPGVVYQYRLYLDGHSAFPFSSPGMYDIYEVTPEEVREDASPVFTRIHPDDYDNIVETISESARSQTLYHIEFRVILPKQGLRWRLCDAKPERMEDGSTLWYGIISDITERKHSELMLRLMNEELIQTNEELIIAKEHAEESDRLKSAFLANMSHEIRTPMNGILGFAGLLKEPKLTGEEQQEYISIIEKSGARMLNIINDIVDISKIESGQMKITVSETNVNEQIEYITIFLKPEAERKGIQLNFNNSLPAKEAIIKTDKEKVYSILTNLVKNAIKYSDKGSIEVGYNLKKTIGIAGETTELEFYVKDTGIGIPLDRQQAIFDRFVQADIGDKRAFQGAGLGLTISKAYVEMLSGKIWVESEEGKGSVFYFTLPYNGVHREKKVIENIVLNEGVEDRVKNLKILIAEDDETSGMLIEIVVKVLSKEVLKARTGVEAVEACRNNPDLDFVLMDIKMPEIDGYEAARQIRKFNNDVIIIAQTAYALIGDREKALEAGCNDYIAKPFGRSTLTALIDKHLKKQEGNN